MNQDQVNDLLHIAWGIWIALVVTFTPLWAVAVLAVLPREMEQTYHALNGRGLLQHVSRWSYWSGKLRDLAGFAIGGAVIHFIIN